MTIRRALPLLLLSVATGCSFFSHTKNRIFTLDRVPRSGAVANVRGLPYGIDSLELPPGLDRKEIVVRQRNQQLDVRGTEQWSASFQPAVLHALAFDLADRLPEGMVILPGEAKPVRMRSIDVVFEELAAGPENAVILDARWVLREPGRADVAHHERFSVDVPSLDSASVAGGVSRALAALADRMVAQLPAT